MAIATATVSFAAVDNMPATWTLTSATPKVLAATATITDGSGPVAISIASPTNTGCTINASAAFTGSVTVVASD